MAGWRGGVVAWWRGGVVCGAASASRFATRGVGPTGCRSCSRTASRLAHTDPLHANDSARASAGIAWFLRVIAVTIRDGFVNVRASEVAFRKQSIVGVTEQLEIVGDVGPTVRPSVSVMDLQESARLTTHALIADESAAKAIARDQLSSNVVRDVLAPPVLDAVLHGLGRSCRLFALGCWLLRQGFCRAPWLSGIGRWRGTGDARLLRLARTRRHTGLPEAALFEPRDQLVERALDYNAKSPPRFAWLSRSRASSSFCFCSPLNVSRSR